MTDGIGAAIRSVVDGLVAGDGGGDGDARDRSRARSSGERPAESAVVEAEPTAAEIGAAPAIDDEPIFAAASRRDGGD